VDISIYNATAVAPSLIEERASLVDGNEVDTGDDVMADGSENLMLKLKFLPYKLRTFLIRNGLAILFSKGLPAYKDYYMRQMKIWGTSTEKQRELSQLLSEWYYSYLVCSCCSLWNILQVRKVKGAGFFPVPFIITLYSKMPHEVGLL
jgi:hypothetical protein